jgi:hypothetical protein
MARAWGAMPQRTEITLEDADAAILLGEYQVRMREFYAPAAGESARDKHISIVENAVKHAGQISLRELRTRTNANRFREDFDRAMTWLENNGKIVIRDAPKNSKLVCWVSGADTI